MLGRVFEGVMAPDVRRASGTYYTPAALVRALLDQALIPLVAHRLGSPESVAERRLSEGDISAWRLARTLTVLDPAVGSGAFLYRGDTKTELRVSEIANPADLKLVVSRSHRDKATDALVSTLGITSERPSGSVGIKVGLITEREADLYIHPSNKSSRWDACAPDAILHAAGGIFLDLAGERYRYDAVQIPNERGIFACNAACAEKVLPAAREAARAAGLPV